MVSGTASEDTLLQSRLLTLPAELRLHVWEYLLAPKSDEAQWLENKTALTTISRMCYLCYPAIPGSDPARSRCQSTLPRSHNWDDRACACHSRIFYALESKESLCPTILRVSRQVNSEALPCLYRRRTFVADPNRTFTVLHDRMCEGWFLLDRFLASLSIEARLSIHNVRVSMLLSQFEAWGSRTAFYGISSKLPALRNLDLEVSPSAIREHDPYDHTPTALALHGIGHPALDTQSALDEERDWPYFLGPVMAFADANINIVAVDKYDLSPTVFDRVKTAIEIRVWKQLLPARMKRDKRKIARMRKTLEAREREGELVILSILSDGTDEA
jgi:hypothetical protein